MGVVEREIGDIKRFEEILQILFEAGFGIFLSKLDLLHRVPLLKRVAGTRKDAPAPERLRRTLERLGPTFVKFGQIMAQRPDFVPREYVQELEKLEDSVPPFDSGVALETMREEIEDFEGKFERVEKEPIASASIAQVHRGVLKGGEEVVLKVRRPGIKQKMERDMDILKFLSRRAEKHSSRARKMEVHAMFREFATWTSGELNLKREARNAQIMSENLEDEEKIVIPHVYSEMTTEKVLVMEYVEGVKCNDEEALESLEVDGEDIARTAVRAGVKQTVRDGFFHADPHPSNFLIGGGGKLIYLDFGMVGKFSKRMRKNIGLLLLHAVDENVEAAVDVVRRMGRMEEGADLEGLRDDIEESILTVKSTTIEEHSITRALFDIAVRAASRGVHMPSSLLIMAKSMLTMEGIGLTIYPEFEITEEYREVVERTLWDMNRPTDLFRSFLIDLVENRDLLTRFPSNVNRALEGISREPRVEVIENREEASNFPVVIAALVIASALLAMNSLPDELMLYGGIGIFIVAVLLSLLYFR